MSVRHILLFTALFCAIAFPSSAAKRFVNGKIAFVSNRDGNLEIYVMNPDGSGQTRLTHNPGNDTEPAWSPDGRQIAFVRAGRIHVMNADGSGETLILGQTAHHPAWSPDGRLIAFTGFQAEAEIFVMSPTGTNLTRLTNAASREATVLPAWSPDGRSIAFSCISEPPSGFTRNDLCVMNANGTNITNLTNHVMGPYDTTPSFSPDGNVIVFARIITFTNRQRVMVMNADGSNPTALALGAEASLESFDATHPVFSPDGKKIAFAGVEAFQTDQSIRVMDADGSNEVQLTSNFGVDDFHPSWQRATPPETTGVYRPSTGQWLLRNSNTSGNANITLTFGGQPGDLPVAGDWNGDGRTDIAVFRNGTFVRALLAPSGICVPCQQITVASPLDSVAFGAAGDLPVAGDWNGDGKDDLGVFRPGAPGTFLLRVPQSLDQICPLCVPSHTIFVTKTVVLGSFGQFPIAGDFDGDGIDSVGVFDPTSATFAVTDDDDSVRPLRFAFGLPGDRPLAGGWAGNVRDGVGVFRPSTTTMVLASDIAAPPDFVFAFGVGEGLPVAGHWTAVSP